MNPQLQHDATTKQRVKDMLYHHLYDPVELQFEKRLHALIEQNRNMGGYSHPSFVYKGQLYQIPSPSKPPRKANRLQPPLVPVMDEYLKDLQYLNEKELPYVLGYITKVLNLSSDFEDYLRLLPDSLHPPLQKMMAGCPCKTRKLSDDTVQQVRQENAALIAMMKQRMMTNLIV